MASSALGVAALVAIVSISAMASLAMADASGDRDQCVQQLTGLATCLPYVGGNAKAPTPDCCSGLKQVLKSNKTCLCVVIRDRNDPELGLKINVTLALRLPSVCNAPANVSECPALLHMDPNSPEAQVFYQFGKSSTSSASSPAFSPSGAISPATSSTGEGPSAPRQTSGCHTQKNWVSLEIVSLLGLLLFFHV